MIRKLALLALLAASPLFAQHTYWRLITTTTNSSFAMVGQWTSFDSGGSTISTAGGTSSASNQGFGSASNAFNGTTNCSTFWQAANNGLTGEWLKYQFASPAAIDHIDLVYGCNGGYGLVDFALQFSDDNSSWTELHHWNGVNSGGATTTLHFTAANAAPAAPAVYWRLSFSATSGCVGMSSLVFYPGANATGTPLSTARLAALASSDFGPANGAYGAIAVTGSGAGWGSATGATRTETWKYMFDSIVSPGSLQFSSGNIGGCGQVNNLAVAYSLDGVTYTTSNTFTPTWSGTETKTFNITGGPNGFASGIGAFVVGP